MILELFCTAGFIICIIFATLFGRWNDLNRIVHELRWIPMIVGFSAIRIIATDVQSAMNYSFALIILVLTIEFLRTFKLFRDPADDEVDRPIIEIEHERPL